MPLNQMMNAVIHKAHMERDYQHFLFVTANVFLFLSCYVLFYIFFAGNPCRYF